MVRKYLRPHKHTYAVSREEAYQLVPNSRTYTLEQGQTVTLNPYKMLRYNKREGIYQVTEILHYMPEEPTP
jgi:hypothetical protein